MIEPLDSEPAKPVDTDQNDEDGIHANAIRPSLVSLVGAGPGDPGLITVAGLRRLSEADVVVYDRLAGPGLLKSIRADAELIYVGKQPTRHTLSQKEINAVLIHEALLGKRVCRLKGGDPFVFGRGGEEALACLEAGVPFEIIPGVTSAIAVPAYAGIPVTHRKIAASFAIVTGHEDPTRGSSSINWAQLATATDTLLFLMGVERLEEIAGELMRHGRSPATPVAVVEWGTLSRQRTVVGVLDDIAVRCKEVGLQPPAVTVVGDVVALRDQLRWFDRRPLSGKRVLVTRARDQVSDLSRLLEDYGAEVLEYPTIRIRPFGLDEAPALSDTLRTGQDWFIFTSVNAVECFFSLVREGGGDARSIGTAKIAAVGPVTANAVERAGLRVDFIPQEATGERIAATFPEPLAGLRLLIPRALVAPEDLPAAFESADASVTVVPVYETVPDDGGGGTRDRLTNGEVDWITFTSSSTVKNFLKEVTAADVPDTTKIACIGPITAETARTSGLRVDVTAAEHTISGLVSSIMDILEQETPSQRRNNAE